MEKRWLFFVRAFPHFWVVKVSDRRRKEIDDILASVLDTLSSEGSTVGCKVFHKTAHHFSGVEAKAVVGHIREEKQGTK